MGYVLRSIPQLYESFLKPGKTIDIVLSFEFSRPSRSRNPLFAAQVNSGLFFSDQDPSVFCRPFLKGWCVLEGAKVKKPI